MKLEDVIQGDPALLLRNLATPFFENGAPQVFAACCCGRLFLGAIVPSICRTCEKKPEFATFTSLGELRISAIPTNTPPAVPIQKPVLNPRIDNPKSVAKLPAKKAQKPVKARGPGPEVVPKKGRKVGRDEQRDNASRKSRVLRRSSK